jgi:hypothetical protein
MTHPTLVRKGLVLTAAGSLAACALVSPPPAAQPPLNEALATRILAVEQSQTALVQALFRAKRAEADRFIDSVWTPVFLDNLAAKPEVKQVLKNNRKRGKASAKPADPALAMDLIPAARAEIEQRRARLHAPIDALEQRLLARLAGQTRAMDSINAALSTNAKAGSERLPAAVMQPGAASATAIAELFGSVDTALARLQAEAPRSAKLLAAFPKLAEDFERRLDEAGLLLG